MLETLDSKRHIISRDPNGNIDTVMACEKIALETSAGILVPRYSLDEQSRRKEAPIKFYKSGELKSVPLQEAVEIESPAGPVKAELVTFYKSGAIRRLFPLDGKISGYWTEENEYKLAEVIDIPTPMGTISVKPIYIQFYESGELESVAFWPRERTIINSPAGRTKIRKGISFYQNGGVKSFEPAREFRAQSPIGVLTVYDPDPNGLNAESGAIAFYENGEIQSLVTSSSQVSIKKDGRLLKTFSPVIITSYCDESSFFVSPLKIIFEEDCLIFVSNRDSDNRFPKSLQYVISDYKPEKPISNIACG